MWRIEVVVADAEEASRVIELLEKVEETLNLDFVLNVSEEDE
jgi:hypothetical protein